MDEWVFPPTFKFDVYSKVETVEGGPVKAKGSIHSQGQRTAKNKKGVTVFECNSYQVLDLDDKLHYFLENELK